MVNLKIVCDMCNKQENCKHLPYCLLNEEELDEKTSILQNKLKALDEIIKLHGKFVYDDYGYDVSDILEKYNLVNKKENV